MLVNIEGILIYKIKFSETSLIIHLLTKEYGVKPFIIKGIRSNKSKNNIALFDYLSIVSVVAWMGKNTEILTIKEVNLEYNYTNLSGNIIQNSIFLFISELLHKLLIDNSPDSDIFHFTKNSLIEFDKSKKFNSDFHLWYFTNLTKYLGIMPINNFNQNNLYLDITKSKFVDNYSDNKNIFSKETSYMFFYYLTTTFADCILNRFSIDIRVNYLDNIIVYYNYHYDKFKNLNSPSILKSVLR